ncbi:hypothetical protein LAZ67_21001310 [Cordylochernes scorpioides]|uniref:Mos1 transposase HTH domain-containing protein n=1 Tax=Cordylochernes scorpioides TaxID=51811 RepID=A0ABY6LP82_9ARAC|nr:hypothetical protein LAZ67_21001310 [Cordylochernes scorpioides]
MEDQRICIKFCLKNGFKGAEIFWMLQTTAYGDAVMSRRRVFEWYKRFKEGREETADNERSGRPSTSTTPEKVDKVLELTSEWRFKNEPRQKKARKAPSKDKVMLTVFFDYQGIVHHEFQQQGSTITADSYLGVLRRLREAIRQKRPELWRSKSWILHHDNAPAHTVLKISKFLQDHSTSVFPQPPYSPDLAPCVVFLFGKLKKKLKGRKFQSIEEIKVELKKAMKAIPKTDYQRTPEINGCLNLEATTDDPELLKRVITGDETWIYGFDRKTTQQASEWRFKNEPRPKKARKAPSKVKVMLTVFFDYQYIVHHDFNNKALQ